VVAAFDFDGTLTRGGSVWPFLVAMVGARRVVRVGLALSLRLAAAALLGGHWADDAKEALFRGTLGGLPADDLEKRAAAFGRAHFRRRARADVRRRLEWHRARGHRLVIVSASPDLYLIPVGADLEVDAVMATRLAVGPDGRLTGDYDGRNCRGPEKFARLSRWIEEEAKDPALTSTGDGAITTFLWAYGNSEGDKQLLAGADVGVDAGRLGRLGALRSFRRLSDVDDHDPTDDRDRDPGPRDDAPETTTILPRSRLP
jgi:phosphatidylglycerophosphatase C